MDERIAALTAQIEKLQAENTFLKWPPGRGGYFLCVASLKAHSGNFKAAGPPILFLFLGTDGCLQQTQCEQNDGEGGILSSV